MSTRPDDNKDEENVSSSVSKKDHDDDGDGDIEAPSTTVSLSHNNQKKKKRTVQFPSSPQQLVTQSHCVPSAKSWYDRTAVPTDIFTCDVCHADIAAGIRGFEPYATCPTCQKEDGDGFDVCGVCCGGIEVMMTYRRQQECTSSSLSKEGDNNDDIETGDIRSRPTPPPPQTIRLKCHPHELTVIDRQAEVAWANGKVMTATAAASAADDDDDDDDDVSIPAANAKREEKLHSNDGGAQTASHSSTTTTSRRRKRRTL
jgi:hypothetical protein